MGTVVLVHVCTERRVRIENPNIYKPHSCDTEHKEEP